MRILVSGAGIAGLTLAACLQHAGADVVLIERAPALRGEGYMIDFWGGGYDVAASLGLLAQLEAIHYGIDALKVVAPDGRTRVRVSYPALRRVLGGRHFNFMRGDLERVLYERVQDFADIRWGLEVRDVTQAAAGVTVGLSSGAQLCGDVLVAADGIRSHVRSLIFGAPGDVLRDMGYDAAAYTLDSEPQGGASLRAGLGNAFYTLSAPGRQVGVYPIRNGRLATFFLHRRRPDDAPVRTLAAAAHRLRQRYGDMPWVVPQLLEAADSAEDLYYDAVAQIDVQPWSRGRVVLLGDAACCVSLVAGQGASAAMAGAALLARELIATPQDPVSALGRYEAALSPQVQRIQRAARSAAKYFAPETPFAEFVRDLSLRVIEWPLAWRLVRGQFAGVRLPKQAA